MNYENVPSDDDCCLCQDDYYGRNIKEEHEKTNSLDFTNATENNQSTNWLTFEETEICEPEMGIQDVEILRQRRLRYFSTPIKPVEEVQSLSTFLSKDMLDPEETLSPVQRITFTVDEDETIPEGAEGREKEMSAENGAYLFVPEDAAVIRSESANVARSTNISSQSVLLAPADKPNEIEAVKAAKKKRFPSMLNLILEALRILDAGERGSTYDEIKASILERYPDYPTSRFGTLFKNSVRNALMVIDVMQVGENSIKLPYEKCPLHPDGPVRRREKHTRESRKLSAEKVKKEMQEWFERMNM